MGIKSLVTVPGSHKVFAVFIGRISASFLLLFDNVFQHVTRFQFSDLHRRVDNLEEAFEHRDLFLEGFS